MKKSLKICLLEQHSRAVGHEKKFKMGQKVEMVSLQYLWMYQQSFLGCSDLKLSWNGG